MNLKSLNNLNSFNTIPSENHKEISCKNVVVEKIYKNSHFTKPRKVAITKGLCWSC